MYLKFLITLDFLIRMGPKGPIHTVEKESNDKWGPRVHLGGNNGQYVDKIRIQLIKINVTVFT